MFHFVTPLHNRDTCGHFIRTSFTSSPPSFGGTCFSFFATVIPQFFKGKNTHKQTDCTLQHGTPNVNSRSWRFSRCRAWTWLWSALARCKASGNGWLNLAWGGVGGIFAAAGAVGCTSAALASVLLPLWAPCVALHLTDHCQQCHKLKAGPSFYNNKENSSNNNNNKGDPDEFLSISKDQSFHNSLETKWNKYKHAPLWNGSGF